MKVVGEKNMLCSVLPPPSKNRAIYEINLEKYGTVGSQ